MHTKDTLQNKLCHFISSASVLCHFFTQQNWIVSFIASKSSLKTLLLCVCESTFAKLTVDYNEDQKRQRIVWNSIVCYKLCLWCAWQWCTRHSHDFGTNCLYSYAVTAAARHNPHNSSPLQQALHTQIANYSTFTRQMCDDTHLPGWLSTLPVR